ncbi:MAG TPA: hypothetical protein VHR47_10155 [Bacillota bacterium]|nr:hypothetical protein [Bacillota bacterium]
MKQSKPKTEKTAVAKKTQEPSKKGNLIKRAYELLFHEDVYFRRIGGFLLWGIILLVISWAVGYLFIKNPVLKDTFLVNKLFGIKGSAAYGKWGVEHFGKQLHFFKWSVDTLSFFNTWVNVVVVTLKNFAHNLVIAFLFIFVLNHFRIKRFPLGYFFFALFTIATGLVVGTNSYIFPPQWSKQIGAVITFIRFGFWQWFAYGLLTVSTLNWGWFSSKSLLAGDWVKLRSFWPPRFANRDDREVFIYGLLFLLAASFAEARLIVHYSYHLIF